MTNKTPVGTYRGPGRFETDFFRERLFDIVAQDLGIDRVEFRRKNLVAHAEMPYRLAGIAPYPHEDELDSGDYQETLDRCLKEIGWAEKIEAAGQADRRPLSRPRHRLLHRGRRRRPEGDGAARDQRRRHDLGVHRLVGGRAGRRDRVRADRRRRARNPDGPHPLACITARPRYVSDGYGAYHSRSVVMGGSALLDAANNFRAALQRGGREAARLQARRRSTLGEDKVSGAGRQVAAAVRLRRAYAGRRVPQQEAHLQLRRAGGACGGRSEDRPRRADRLRRGAGRRPHHQSADAEGPGDRLAGAGARRRVPRAPRL